jgi:hypothetical protein
VDGDDAGEEGLEVIGSHLFQGVQTCEGEGDFGTHLHQPPQIAHKVFRDFLSLYQFLDFLEFV